jgi:prephenate dehydrogenase
MGTVGIVGLGLIGGSLGLALKQAKLGGIEVAGFDQDSRVGGRAHSAGAVDRVAPTIERLASDSDLLIIATPILSVRKVMEEVAPHLRRGAVVTDTASTKGSVMRWAREILPREVNFIGGHPLAGKETSGPQAAEASLFTDRPYVIVPMTDSAPAAVNGMVGLARIIGARPVFLDADEHDSYTASISHMPLLASVALFSLVRGSQAWPELANIAGPAFRDLTRLASGQPEMAHDICLTNRENIVHWIDRYMEEIYRLRDLVQNAEGDEDLFRAFVEAQLARDSFMDHLPERDPPGSMMTEVPTSNDAFMTLVAGGYLAQRAKDVTNLFEENERERNERERRQRRRD